MFSSGSINPFIMENHDLSKTEDGFSRLSLEEQMVMYGGLYRGPVLPHIWLQLLLDKWQYRED